jgi:DNA-binding PadR family transcriptional regulator
VANDNMADGPLTDLAFNILVALTGEPLHGYALVKRLRRLEGRGSLRTGTIYAALARLEEDGLVAETDEPDPDAGDSRRRYYRVTARGMASARAEAARLAEVLARARGKRLLGETAGG